MGLRDAGDPIIETLHILFPMDVILLRAGADFSEAPANYVGEWPDHLRWATDASCQAARMLLAGNAVAAAAVSRAQLERWSENRAASNNMAPMEGEEQAVYYTRLWAGEQPEIDAGQVWTNLSELLHGRGPLVRAARWDTVELGDLAGATASKLATDTVLSAVQLALRQVLLCVLGLSAEMGDPPDFQRLLYAFPMALPSEVQLRQESIPFVWPMTLDYVRKFCDWAINQGEGYLDDAQSLANHSPARDMNYSSRSVEAFVSRRSRAAATARRAFEEERTQVGERFDPSVIKSREFGYIILNETAGLLASWNPGPISDALVTAACALRGSFWLWLEDDDRALVLVRTVLEQTARVRTWRLKPDKAQRLEDRGDRTTPRDWLEEAGWRRLSVLNRSLGDFAHAGRNLLNWGESRQVLADLQPEASSEIVSEPIQTARGGVLDEVAHAFGSELLHVAVERHKYLADALKDVLPYGDDDGPHARIEAWLARCWAYRGGGTTGTPGSGNA
jgi:hypothetical protein